MLLRCGYYYIVVEQWKILYFQITAVVMAHRQKKKYAYNLNSVTFTRVYSFSLRTSTRV